MTKCFAVVYEDQADFRTATELADRVLVDAIDWLEEDQLPYQRAWQSENTNRRPLTWTAIKRLARKARIRSHGHFQGEPGLPDAAAARRAMDYLVAEFSQVDAIVLIRDQDDEPERWAGLEQARCQARHGIPIVLGLAVVEREAWAISGFEPQNEAEISQLTEERQTLGFDPRSKSHELTACKDDTALRSPKRVLRQLSGTDGDRERLCWLATPLAILRQRGDENGLAAYLCEVRDRLVPLIGHAPQE